MNKIALDTKMKLMNMDNVSYSLNTKFVYEVPSYIYNCEGLKVTCSLVDSTTMAYSLSENFDNLILDTSLSVEAITKRIEFLLWGLSTIKYVQLEENENKAYLIKEGLFVR